MRAKDRRYVRYIGPADRSKGEFRGQPVELLGNFVKAHPSDLGTSARVRFPDGSESMVHEDHLTDVIFRAEASA